MRGGTAAAMSAKLRRLGLPPIANDLPPAPVRIVWNPQGYGSPDIPQNSAQAYYPGDAYVDVVANDLYDQGFNAAWDANERLYAAHPGKRYAIGEWGLWSVDDPAFVERMATFVEDASAGRVRRVLQRPGGVAVGPRDEALEPSRLPQADHAARSLNARTASTVRSTSSSVWASEGNRHSNCEGGT